MPALTRNLRVTARLKGYSHQKGSWQGPVLAEGILYLSSPHRRSTDLRQPMNPAQQHPSLARYAPGRGRTLERGRLGPPEQAQGPRAQRRIPPHPCSLPHAVRFPPASLGPSPPSLGVCRDQGPFLPALPPTRAPYPSGGAQARACLTPVLESVCGHDPPPTPFCPEGVSGHEGPGWLRGPATRSFSSLGNFLHPVCPFKTPSPRLRVPSLCPSHPQPRRQRTLRSSNSEFQ